jgi:hypothetical protein
MHQKQNCLLCYATIVTLKDALFKARVLAVRIRAWRIPAWICFKGAREGKDSSVCGRPCAKGLGVHGPKAFENPFALPYMDCSMILER